MKKMFYALGLGLTLTTSAFALNSNLDKINKVFTDALVPFQNETTVVRINFNSLDFSSERVTKFGLDTLYSRVGAKNKLEFKIDQLAYDFGNNTPKTTFKASVGTDITKILSQEELDRIIPNIQEVIESLSQDRIEDYGDALLLESTVTSTTKDKDGKYVAISGLLTLKIDLSKLPESVPANEVAITEINVALNVNLSTGASIEGYVVSNPGYKAFEQDQEGMKETLEKLVAGDQETLNLYLSYLVGLDRLAEVVTEG